MWACKACSYRNLNSTAKQCHVCHTARINEMSSASQAVIDLTDFSPKHHAGSMESNRRRRRRLDGGFDMDAANNDPADPKPRQQQDTPAENRTHSGGIKSIRATESKSRVAAATNNKVLEVLEILSSDDDEINDDPGQRNRPHNSGNDEQSKNPSQYDNKLPRSRQYTKRPYKSTEEKKSIKYSGGKMVSDYQTLASSGNSNERKQSSTNSTASKKNHTKKSTSNSKQDKRRSIRDYCNNKNASQPIETLMQQAMFTLKERFGHSSLRPLQETAIRRALQRTHQIVILATGGGKSICYQLPALIGDGQPKPQCSVTIVVCPLIALMVDQVRNLHKKGIMTAACLSSSQTAKEKSEVYSRLCYDKRANKGKKAKSVTAVAASASESTPVQILYVTPELIKTDKFRVVLNKLYESNRLFQIAVDEAHCVSTWGHDFRGAYKELSWLREVFPDVPVMACTGTATSQVINDIRAILRLDVNSAPCIMGTFNRTNISYEVRFKDSLDAILADGALVDLSKVVKQQHEIADKANAPCNGIVYVFRREDCAILASRITKMTGLVCAPYHAGLKPSEREDIQCKWTDGTIKLCVATLAFGMGIDLAHVRYVIHWTMAKSLEGFYQESGRGGRDGKQSISILYYSKDDAERLAYIVQKSSESKAQKNRANRDGVRPQTADHAMVELEGMIDYCTKPGCRRKHVLQHFGEEFDANTQCNMTCDFCKNPEKVEADTRAAECMSAVINSKRVKPKPDEQIFYHNPLAESDESCDGLEPDSFFGADDGLLGITEYAGNQKFAAATGTQKANGFVKASSVLGKYEKMECLEGKKGGFVNFKTRTFNDDNECIERKHRPVEIPAHLRGNMPDPHASSYKKAIQENAPKKQSSDEIKAELEALKRKREAMLKSLGGNSQASSSSSVPSLSFKKRR